MESSITSQSILLNELGMTAHVPKRESALHRNGTAYSCRSQGSTACDSLISNKLEPRRKLNQRSISRKQLPATIRHGPSATFAANDAIAKSATLSKVEYTAARKRDEVIAERKRKAIPLLCEIHHKEELRVAEVRRFNNAITAVSSSQSASFSPSSSQAVNQQDVDNDITEEQGTISLAATALSEEASFFLEPAKLGPRTSNLYQRESLLLARQTSSASGYSTASAASTCVELDGNPVSSLIELPGDEVLGACRQSFEYGDARFNTLPGESYPLTEYRITTELPTVVTVTDHFFDVNDIERQVLKNRIRPDVDPRTGQPTDPW